MGHGTCQHRAFEPGWMRGAPCLRCGMVRGGRRPARVRRGKRHARGNDPYASFEKATPACVPKPLRRSLLQKLKGFFNRKEKKS